ncbi:MAG: hypothetical protein ACRYFU_00035 [Janthinobacterium lividum]
MNISRNTILSSALVVGAFSLSAFAQELPSEGPVATTALITAQSKNNVPFNTAALKLEVNGHAAAIASITPVQTAGAQVAILIDDGLRGSFDVQIRDVKDFVRNLPSGTQVFVGYMQNGTVRNEGGFTTDHAAVADSLRIPLTEPGISASPYFCLSDFVKHWPGQGASARMVLMLTNGVDPYNGSVSPLNQDSPYVQAAQNDAQRAGVAVYSIYYGGAGIRGGAASFSGQNYLQQVADATGGESFYQGTITPPSLAPYLNEFRKSLSESFLVTFNATANHEKRNTLVSIKLKTEQGGVKLHVPAAVHPGFAEQASE